MSDTLSYGALFSESGSGVADTAFRVAGASGGFGEGVADGNGTGESFVFRVREFLHSFLDSSTGR